jgi:hypothetical protein
MNATKYFLVLLARKIFGCLYAERIAEMLNFARKNVMRFWALKTEKHKSKFPALYVKTFKRKPSHVAKLNFCSSECRLKIGLIYQVSAKTFICSICNNETQLSFTQIFEND